MGRCKDEIAIYTFSEEVLSASATTDGSQRKYFDGEFYYKVDHAGNEGLCEYMVSRLLELSSLSKELILPYEQCIVNGASGCRSKNFLGESEVFVTMAQMYRNTQGRTFTFSIEEVLTELKELEQTYEYHTLKERLAKYGDIFTRPDIRKSKAF